jgi:hypothetical protein
VPRHRCVLVLEVIQLIQLPRMLSAKPSLLKMPLHLSASDQVLRTQASSTAVPYIVPLHRHNIMIVVVWSRMWMRFNVRGPVTSAGRMLRRRHTSHPDCPQRTERTMGSNDVGKVLLERGKLVKMELSGHLKDPYKRSAPARYYF